MVVTRAPYRVNIIVDREREIEAFVPEEYWHLTARLSGPEPPEFEAKLVKRGEAAAKVNKEEITVHQINFVLQRQGNVPADQVPAVSKRILESLIDQEVAIQQATEEKLDRDPKVVMAIEAAKREIIARAYADRIADTGEELYARQPDRALVTASTRSRRQTWSRPRKAAKAHKAHPRHWR